MRYTMKFLALVLAVTMGLEGAGVAQEIIPLPEVFAAPVLDEKALKAKAEVTRRGVGEKSKIRVKMRDKHQLTGRITQIDEHSFQLHVEPTFLDDLEPAKGTVLRIPYSEVEKIRSARSRPANLVVNVGAVVLVVVILAGVLVLRAERCRHSYCDP